MGPSPDIGEFRRTFHVQQKRKAFLKCPAICNFFAGHFGQFPLAGQNAGKNQTLVRTFENFAGHVR